MNWSSSAPAASSALAAASVVHVAITLVRKHRSALRSWWHPALILSFAFAASPWIFPAPRQVAVGVGAHLLWFLAGKVLARPARTAGASLASRRPAPAPSAAPAPAVVKPSGFVPTPVLAIFGETEDIRTFRLARPEGFEFQSGQFLTVAVQVGGQRLARCYSISSAPETRGYLEISVKRQGLVSGALHSTVRVGSQLPVRPPAGRFVYPVGDDRPLVLLGGGVGCTPLMSMLRHAVACEPSRPVTYLLSAKTERDIAFRQELSLLARRHPQVQIAVALTRASGNGPGFHVGRIDEPLVRRTVTDPQSALFYVCGPLPMIDAMKTLLRGMGVPDAQIHFEAFGAAVAAAASASAIPASAPQRRPARLASVGRAGFALCLARSGRTTTIGKGQTLLEAAEAAQIEIPSSCRAGICGTCRTRLIEGEVDCDGDALDPADREKGYVLACVAMARTDCAIEA